MPIYEYECRRCGHRLEEMQKISDPPLKRCPECGGGLKKLISAPSFQFKGSGWYVTDYGAKKSADPKGGAAAESKGESKTESKGESSESKGESKSESKTEAKTETKAAGGETAGGGSKRPARSASGGG